MAETKVPLVETIATESVSLSSERSPLRCFFLNQTLVNKHAFAEKYLIDKNDFIPLSVDEKY